MKGITQMMNKEKCTQKTEMEELLPIVAELVKKATSGESTSVTYEKAQQLMEAVLYCVHEAGQETGASLATTEGSSAKSVYEYGYRCVIEKTKKAQKKYNTMMTSFSSYGNNNLSATVRKGISGFFLYYSPRFAPQETILTMDYPTLVSNLSYSGIDAIDRYISQIALEQKFLSAFPEEYVLRILMRHDRGYRQQFFNLAQVLLRHALCKKILQGTSSNSSPYDTLRDIVTAASDEKLEKDLSLCLEKMILTQPNGCRELFEYLSYDLHDFTTVLRIGAENRSLENIVVL